VYNFRESMFEAVRIALGVAANSNGNPRVSWREGASRVFVLLTDEDADPAEFSENLLGLDADLRSVCYADLVAQSRWPQYLNEISVVTQAIIREKVSTYMLTNPPFNPPLNNDSFIPGADRCLVEYQYGSPSLQIQNDDLTGFDSRKTLEGLNKDAKASSSLQARLLGNNVYSRVFDINMVASPAFVNNFFSLIVEDVSKRTFSFQNNSTYLFVHSKKFSRSALAPTASFTPALPTALALPPSTSAVVTVFRTAAPSRTVRVFVADPTRSSRTAPAATAAVFPPSRFTPTAAVFAATRLFRAPPTRPILAVNAYVFSLATDQEPNEMLTITMPDCVGILLFFFSR
jgi:hypothetical protein